LTFFMVANCGGFMGTVAVTARTPSRPHCSYSDAITTP